MLLTEGGRASERAIEAGYPRVAGVYTRLHGLGQRWQVLEWRQEGGGKTNTVLKFVAGRQS